MQNSDMSNNNDDHHSVSFQCCKKTFLFRQNCIFEDLGCISTALLTRTFTRTHTLTFSQYTGTFANLSLVLHLKLSKAQNDNKL